MRITGLLFIAVSLVPSTVSAQMIYSTVGGTISENFDSLNAGNANSNLTWTNNSTLTGWHLFNFTGGGTPLTTYQSSSGNTTTGSFFSFGVAGVNANSDRALGGIGSGGTYFGSPAAGSVAGWIAVNIVNSTGVTIDSVTMNYDGEQWRNGGNTTQHTMVVEYGFGATFTGVGTWTAAGASFDFTGPIATATAGALDGNDAPNRVAGLGGTISSLTWNNGDTLWFRFRETNETGNDHGLALDNFSFSGRGTAVPEPGSLALIGLAASTLITRFRRKQTAAVIDSAHVATATVPPVAPCEEFRIIRLAGK